MGRAHPTAHVLAVAEAAQGLDLELHRADLAGQLQAGPVLAEATFDVAAGEVQVAAKEMDALPVAPSDRAPAPPPRPA